MAESQERRLLMLWDFDDFDESRQRLVRERFFNLTDRILRIEHWTGEACCIVLEGSGHCFCGYRQTLSHFGEDRRIWCSFNNRWWGTCSKSE